MLKNKFANCSMFQEKKNKKNLNVMPYTTKQKHKKNITKRGVFEIKIIKL